MQNILNFSPNESDWFGKYLQNGYYSFDLVISADKAKLLTQAILDFVEESGKNVDEDGIYIKTGNGEALIEFIPQAQEIYDEIYLFMKKSIQNLKKIDTLPIAISANVIERGSLHKFRRHFDRNEYTAVLYLTNSPDYPLTLFPNIRNCPINSDGEWNYSQEENQIIILPHPGRLVIFGGRTSLHGVELVKELLPSSKFRVSLQLAYDTIYAEFEQENYYGAKSDE